LDEDDDEPDKEEEDRPCRVEIHVGGTNAALDADMERALTPHREMARAWGIFHPTGRVDFECDVTKDPDPPTTAGPPGNAVAVSLTTEPDIDLTVNARGCGIRPDFFSYALEDMHGRIHYGRQWVELEKITAHHGDSVMTLEGGNIYLKPGGGVWAELLELRGRPLVPDADFIKALPDALGKACTALELRDPMTVSTKMVINTGAEPGGGITPGSGPEIWWDGWAGMRGAHANVGLAVEDVTGWAACRGLYDGKQLEDVLGNLQLNTATLLKQPFTDVHSQIVVNKEHPQVLMLPGLYAKYFGGEVYGPIHVEFGSTLRYDMRLTASRVKLEEFGKHNLGAAELSGGADATLYLAGQGTDLNNLRGSGTLDVPQGKMYNLPLLVDLIKVLGLRPPDRTAFEEAHASFEIVGPRARVNKVDLLGNAISLRGQGDLNLDGTNLNLDFNVDLARISQVLPPGIKKIPPAISDQLLKIKMRGKIGDVHFDKEPVPGLFGPVKRFIGGKGGD
jgi:hypothetical protein